MKKVTTCLPKPQKFSLSQMLNKYSSLQGWTCFFGDLAFLWVLPNSDLYWVFYENIMIQQTCSHLNSVSNSINQSHRKQKRQSTKSNLLSAKLDYSKMILSRVLLSPISLKRLTFLQSYGVSYCNRTCSLWRVLESSTNVMWCEKRLEYLLMR